MQGEVRRVTLDVMGARSSAQGFKACWASKRGSLNSGTQNVGGRLHTEDVDEEIREYIAKVRWQFAKTMPDWPHEYTVKSWRSDLTDAFVSFCRLIAKEGTVEPWPPPPAAAIYHNRYLVLDGHKYWAMGPKADLDPPEEMTVINRATHPGEP